jgi:hypothetical protein
MSRWRWVTSSGVDEELLSLLERVQAMLGALVR